MSSESEVTITSGGTAQQLLAERLGRSRLIITPITENCWIRWGGTAAVDAGELVYKDSPTQYSGQNFPEIGGALSVFSATTGAKIVIREV